MINIIFAMGENGEFGRLLELHKAIVARTPDEELRDLPKNGLPWHCRSDMLFFRTMTNGIGSDVGMAAYQALRGQFSQNTLHNVVAHAWADDSEYNCVLSGVKTWQQMNLPMSRTRCFLPVSRSILKENGLNNLEELLDHTANKGTSTVWIAGGKEFLMSVLDEFAAGKIHIDNMFVSTIKGTFESDVVIDQAKLMMYIDSNFTYNEEYVENKQVLIQRYRGVIK